jgi:hypothetical protein
LTRAEKALAELKTLEGKWLASHPCLPVPRPSVRGRARGAPGAGRCPTNASGPSSG